MGFGSIPSESNTAIATDIRDALTGLVGLNRLDASAVKNIPTGSILTPWILKTSGFSAVAGERYRIDATTGEVVILLPVGSIDSPEIELQRIDGSANQVLIRTPQKFSGQFNRDGVFAPTVPQLTERLSFTGLSLGWLGQFNQLTYQPSPTSGVIPLNYTSDGDSNGLFYWIGTQFGAIAWSNPASSSNLAVLASSTQLGNPISISDRAASDWYSSALPNSWVAWDLGANNRMQTTFYTLRSRNLDNTNLPRNWVLEGTNTASAFTVAGLNSATWVTIDTRTNDATLTAVNQYYTVPVNGSSAQYRYLRLRQTGINNSSSNFLTLGEIEFYGEYYNI